MGDGEKMVGNNGETPHGFTFPSSFCYPLSSYCQHRNKLGLGLGEKVKKKGGGACLMGFGTDS